MPVGNGNTLIGRDWSRYPGAAITGGGFTPGLPGYNMLRLQPQLGAQTLSSSTTFALTLATAYPVGIVHLQGLVNVSVVSISLGSYSASRLAPPPGYLSDEFAALGSALYFVLPAPITTNTINFGVSGAAPMTIGAVGACEAWQPPFDLVTGSSDTIIDLSDVQTVPFGSTYVTQRATHRRKDCALSYLPDATQNVGGVHTDYEAAAFRIALIAGKHLPVAVVPFPDDDANIERRAVWGLASTDQQFTNQFFGLYQTTFQITQLI